MSVEIEVKYRVDDPASLRARTESIAGPARGTKDQTDRYFQHPARDFRQTDEALRIRSEAAENRLTYKGPKQGGPTKTREEIEIGFDRGPEAAERLSSLLSRLGFQPVATIHKRRTEFQLRRDGNTMTITLDETAELGVFAEVESIADDSADVPAVQQAVLSLAQELGLNQVEPRSYLQMALERQGS
jgi:adenylate cyclase class 2